MSEFTDTINANILRSSPLTPHESSHKSYTISELAREFDITTRAIRFYEAEGLLNPRREGRTRLYNQRDRTRLKLILRGKRLGFSLDEVGELFELYDSATGELAQLRRALEKIAEREQMLRQQLEDIHLTLHELKEFEGQCQKRLRQMRNSH